MENKKDNNLKFTCEACLEKVDQVIRDFQKEKWLCDDCYQREIKNRYKIQKAY